MNIRRQPEPSGTIIRAEVFGHDRAIREQEKMPGAAGGLWTKAEPQVPAAWELNAKNQQLNKPGNDKNLMV